MNRNSAFTLIELTIVISIIAIMLALAAPSLKSFSESTKLRSSASNLKSLLGYARDLAITEKKSYLVAFDLANNRYWLSNSDLIQNGDLEGSTTSETSTATSVQSVQSSQDSALPRRSSMVLGIAKTPDIGVKIAQTSTSRNSQNQDGIDYAIFEPTGQSEDVVIYFQNGAGVLAISVDAATGRTKVHKLKELDEMMER